MGTRLLYCVTIFLLEVDPTHAKITQFPRHLIIGKGQAVTMACDQDTQYNQMFWYQQTPEKDPGSGLQLISYSLNVGFTDTEIPHGYDASRKEKSFFLLTLKSANTNQTSEYFCASSITTAEQSVLFLAQKKAISRGEMTWPHQAPPEKKEGRYYLRNTLEDPAGSSSLQQRPLGSIPVLPFPVLAWAAVALRQEK
uniref:Ig-like domain-containing protein n=1 Tax=Vombatus ursinus TaxID=29139 RepID=A0A4X2LZD3_VOMUR